MKPSRGQRILAVTLCALLAFSVAFYFPQRQARADTIDNVVNELNKVYTMLNEDPEGKKAVEAAKASAAALSEDPAVAPWPAVFNLLPTTAFQAEFGGKDSAERAIVALLRGAAALTYSTDSTDLKKELNTFKTTHQNTVKTILGSDFTVDVLYDFLFVKAKAEAPDALSGLTPTDLEKILTGDYTDSVKNWTREALILADKAYFSGKFQGKLSEIGWSIDSLVKAKEEISKVVDQAPSAEKALLKAYVRSESKFYKDGSLLSAVSLSTGDSTPCKLQVLGIAPGSFAGGIINAFLEWKTGDESIAKIEGKNLKAVAAGQTTLIAYKDNEATDWIFKGTVTVSTPSGGGGGGGPTPPPVEKPVEDIKDQLESGKTTPEQAAKDLAEQLTGLTPEKITEELKTQVQELVQAIIEKAGTVAISPAQITTTDTSATVTVDAAAIAAALANLESVSKTLTDALDKAKITGVLVTKQVVLTVPPEAAAKPEVVVQIPAQSLTDLSNAGAALVVRPSDALAIVFPAVKAQSAALGALVAGTGSGWLDNLVGSAATPAVQIKTRALDAQETARLTANLPATATERISLAGKITEVDITAASGKYTKPVRLLLNYDPAKARDAELLGAYVYDETAGNWRYIDGKALAASKAIDVAWVGFDQYAVMEYDRSFADAITHWARREIKVMAAKHLVAGVSQEDFAPDRQITRAEFAVILARMMNLTADPAGAERFVDVPAGAWYRGMVGAAAKAGLVAGMSENTFAPGELITREQMAAMMARLLKKQKGLTITEAQANQVLASFQDAAAVSAWAKLDVALIAKEEIMKGRAAATFVPDGKSTRAEATVVLYRVLQKI